MEWGVRCARCKWYKDLGKINNVWTGECVLAEVRNSELQQPFSLARAVDADEHEGKLLVSPYFGCVQWEPR